MQIEDNYEFAIHPPSAYVIGNGDTLLYFTVSGLNFAETKSRVYAYCYNLTKKQMVWENKQFVPDRTDRDWTIPSLPPFVIENDKLIITCSKSIHCLNKNTGELIWQRQDLGGMAQRPPLYWEGKLYIRSGEPCILLCLDAQTGQQIWENTTLNPIPNPDGRMAIYKDKLYFAAWGENVTYRLMCVDIHTGKLLWTDRGPYGTIAFDVLIDQKTGYLYCNTCWGTMCVDLNRTPKK
jgi:hypothetical protein